MNASSLRSLDPRRAGSGLVVALALAAMSATAAAVHGGDDAGGGLAALGAALFAKEIPNTHGNGRTCATCHVPADAFGLTPRHVEERYQLLQRRRRFNPNADDPLFRSIDANDGGEDFTHLRKHALVRVFIRLPTDAEGRKRVWPVDDPEATEVAVWRSTPTVLNTAFTAPYQLDGRQPTLQSQALGALIDHARITVAPQSRFLDALAAFQETLFSSPQVAGLARALAEGQPPPPTDPELNELERRGKALFERHCAICHGGPTQTVPLPELPDAVRDIFISKPLPPFAADLPFAPSPIEPRLWAFRVPGQSEPVVVASTDPGQALLTGDLAQLNFSDIPALYGVSKTAPYFRDNSAATLEEMVRHYQWVFEATRRVVPEGVPWPLRPDPITEDQFAPLIAYLTRL